MNGVHEGGNEWIAQQVRDRLQEMSLKWMVNNWGKNVNCILGDEVKQCVHVSYFESPFSCIHACQCYLASVGSKRLLLLLLANHSQFYTKPS